MWFDTAPLTRHGQKRLQHAINNFPTWNIRNVWHVRDDGHHYQGTIMTRIILMFSRTVRLHKNTTDYPNKVWDKSKMTRSVGIAQLTHHLVHNGSKNPETGGRGELIAQYRSPKSFCYSLIHMKDAFLALYVEVQLHPRSQTCIGAFNIVASLFNWLWCVLMFLNVFFSAVCESFKIFRLVIYRLRDDWCMSIILKTMITQMIWVGLFQW